MAEPSTPPFSSAGNHSIGYPSELDALPYPQGPNSPTMGSESAGMHGAPAGGDKIVDQRAGHIADADEEDDAGQYFSKHLSCIIEPPLDGVQLESSYVSETDEARTSERHEHNEAMADVPPEAHVLGTKNHSLEDNDPKAPPIDHLPIQDAGMAFDKHHPHTVSQPVDGPQIGLNHPLTDTSYLDVLTSQREARHHAYTPGSLLPIQSPPNFETLSPIPLTPRGHASGSGSRTSGATLLPTPPLGSKLRSSWSPTTDGYDDGDSQELDSAETNDDIVRAPKTSRWRNFSLGVEEGHHSTKQSRHRTGFELMQGWPGYKWVLFLSVVIVSLLGTTGLLYAFLTWFRAWKHAGVMAIVDSELLLLITFSSAFFLLTALPGFTGTLFDSQQLLTMYTLFQILCLVLITAVFYLSHKRATSTLPEALQLSWTQVFTPIDRLAIQHSLHCCGYQNAFQSATRSEDCHAGTSLPGCKQAFVDFESRNLGKIWRGAVVCGLIFLVDIFVGYLCAQRLTGVFIFGRMGKGSRGDGQTRRILEKLKSFRLGRGRSSGASADSEDIVLNIRKPEPSQPRARADTRAVSSGVRHEGHGHNGREASLNGRNGNGGGYDRDYFSNAHQGQGYAF